jgi:leucyl-tRNA synthetase
MSKSKGNSVQPDELIAKYGADTFRLYTLFIGPPERDAEWDDRAVEGGFRFLNRVWRLFQETLERPDYAQSAVPKDVTDDDRDMRRKTHGTIQKVTQDMTGGFRFNTAISALMELLNMMQDTRKADRPTSILRRPRPWCVCSARRAARGRGDVAKLGLPQEPVGVRLADGGPLLAEGRQGRNALQVNGKIRRAQGARGMDEAAIRKEAESNPSMREHIDPAKVVKVVWVQDRLANFVVRP